MPRRGGIPVALYTESADEVDGDSATRASSFRIEALEPRILLSADPVSGEFARILDSQSQDDGTEDISAIVQDVTDSAEIRSESSVDAAAPSFTWPAGWNGPSDELRDGTDQQVLDDARDALLERFADDGSADWLAAIQFEVADLDEGQTLAFRDNVLLVDIDAIRAGGQIDVASLAEFILQGLTGGQAVEAMAGMVSVADAGTPVAGASGTAAHGAAQSAADEADSQSPATTYVAAGAATDVHGADALALASGSDGASSDESMATQGAAADGSTTAAAGESPGAGRALAADDDGQALADDSASIGDGVPLAMLASSLRSSGSNRSARNESGSGTGKPARTTTGGTSTVSRATESDEPASSDADDETEARAPPAIQSVTSINEFETSGIALEQDALSASNGAEDTGFGPADDDLASSTTTDSALPRGPPSSGTEYLRSVGTPDSDALGDVMDATLVDLTSLFVEAKARWTASGLIPAGYADPTLSNLTLIAGDLPAGILASITGTEITVDTSADGFGWYVDPDLKTDDEFSGTVNGVDLLTAVMHEIGHALGYEHGAAAVAGLMSNTLAPGERHVPGEPDQLLADGANLNAVIDAILDRLDKDNPPPNDQVIFSSADGDIPGNMTVGVTIGGGVDLQLGAVTLTFTGLTYNTTTSKWEGFVGVEAETATLTSLNMDVAIVDSDADADNFAVVGVVSLTAGTAATLDFDSMPSQGLGLPTFIEFNLTDIRLEFADFRGNDNLNGLHYRLEILGFDTGVPALNDLLKTDNPFFELKFEGFIEATLELKKAEDALGAGPYTAQAITNQLQANYTLDGGGMQARGHLFKILTIDVGILFKTVEYNGESTWVFGIKGELNFGEKFGGGKEAGNRGGNGVFALAFSKYGPLHLYGGGGPIPLGTTGITLETFALGFRFQTTIEDMQVETDFVATDGDWNAATSTASLTIPDHDLDIGNRFRVTDASNPAYNGVFVVTAVSGDTVFFDLANDPGPFVGTSANVVRLTITDPRDLLDDGLANGIAPPESLLDWEAQLDAAVINQLTNQSETWTKLFGEVTIGGKALASFTGIPDWVLLLDVDLLFDTEGQILLNGALKLFDGAFTSQASLYADVGELVAGNARFMFIWSVLEVPVFDPLVLLYGDLEFGTLDSFSVLDMQATPNTADGTWTVELELPTDVPSDFFALGETVLVQDSDPAGLDGIYEITGVDDATNTITFVADVDPGTWTVGSSTATLKQGSGFFISIGGGVDVNIPGIDADGNAVILSTLTLSTDTFGGPLTLEVIAPPPSAEEELQIRFSADVTLSESSFGTIGRANGEMQLLVDTDAPLIDSVTVFGAMLVTLDTSFTEQFGLFVDASAFLVFNSGKQDQDPIQLTNAAGVSVSVTPTAQTFQLRLDGSMGLRIDFNDNSVFEPSEQMFLLKGVFVFSFSSVDGLNVVLFSETGPVTSPTLGPATLELGPAGSPWLTFNVFGFLAIRSNGVAANLILSLNASAPGAFASVANVDAQFVLMLNTTGEDIYFDIPAGASDPGRPSGLSVYMPRAPPGSLENANLDISALINGNAWTLDAGDVGVPYIIVHAGGTNPAVSSDAQLTLGPFLLKGQFSFLLTAEVNTSTNAVTPLLEIGGKFLLDISVGPLTFLQLEGRGSLRYDSTGLVADIQFSQRQGAVFPSGSMGFELTASYRLQIDTGQGLYRLRMTGSMNVLDVVTLSGRFDLRIDTSTRAVTLDFDASLTLFGVEASLTGSAVLAQNGFTLDVELSLATGNGLSVVDNLFSVEGVFRLHLSTVAGSKGAAITVSGLDGGSAASVNLMGLVMSGALTIGVQNGDFFINIPDTAPLTLDFFGFASLSVSGSYNYDKATGGASGSHAFNFKASAGFKIGIEGVLGVSATLEVEFDSATGTFKGSLDGTAWIAGFSLDVDTDLTIRGSAISLSLSVTVTITPAFTIWNPFGRDIRVPALRATYRHTFNIGNLTEQGDFAVPNPDPPVLATPDETDSSILYLNIGLDADRRDPGEDWDDEDVNESFRVTHVSVDTAGNETVLVDAFGFQIEYAGVRQIVVTDAGAGEDVIIIEAGVLADAVIHGGDDDDQIFYLGSGRAELYGDDGNDRITGGSGGTVAAPDVLDGGTGNDRLEGGSGVSNVYGRAGADTIVWNEINGAILATIDGGSDGTIVISTDPLVTEPLGDTLEVVVNGASETVDVSAAGSGAFNVTINGSVAAAAGIEGLILDVEGGADTVTINDVTTSPLDSIIVRLGQNGTGTADDGARDQVVINGSTGADNVVVVSADGDGDFSDDTIRVDFQNSAFIAIEQGYAANGSLALGDHLTINGNGGADTIDASGVDTLLLNMAFNFGNDGGSLLGSLFADLIEVAITGNSAGTLRLDGRGGADTYTVQLNGGNTNATITIADSGGTAGDSAIVNGTSGAEVIRLYSNMLQQGSNTETINYSGLENITVNTLGDSDRVTVFSTHTGTTLINTGIGADLVAVQGISGPTTVQTGAGADHVNVGSLATPDVNTGGTLDQLDALLTIDAGAGATETDILDISDAGDVGISATPDGTLTGSSVTGLGMSHGINYSNVEALRIGLGRLDTLGSQFLVASTHAGSTTIDGSDLGDTIDIRSVAGATFVNTGDGADTINVGNSSGRVDDVDGALSIDAGAGPGNDVLNINDNGDTSANTDGVLTGAGLTGLGMSAGISYQNVEDLNIRLGSGNDEFLVVSTNAGTTTSIYGNNGTDRISVHSISGATIVDGGAASDYIHVGSNAAPTSNDLGNLNSISALLTVIGGTADTDVLDIDDSGDPDDNTDGRLTAGTLTGLGMLSGIHYSGVEDLQVHLGKGNDQLTVVDTHNQRTTIDGNAGNDLFNILGIEGTVYVNGDAGGDIFNVSHEAPMLPSNEDDTDDVLGNVDQVDGLLVVQGGGQSGDVLNVDNSNPAATGQNGTLTGSTLRGLAMPQGINYGGIGTLNIWLDDGGNVFDIKSTHGNATNIYVRGGADEINVLTSATGSTTSIFGQAGNDTINIGEADRVDDVDGRIVLHGGSGADQDQVNVNNAAETLAREATLTSDTLRGLGLAGGVDYAAVEDLNVYLGTGTDVFYVDSTHAGTTQLYGGSGATGTRDDTIAIRSIGGTTTVHGQGGDDAVVVNVALPPGTDLPSAAANDDQFVRTHANGLDINGIGTQGTGGVVLNLHGENGSDHYVVNLSGTGDAIVNVDDNAEATDDGVDVLTINGADGTATEDDTFLLRRDFVALLNRSVATVAEFDQVERVNYNDEINGRLIVNGLGGNDTFAADDNSALTTIDGGAGNDSFQIGQIFATLRTAEAANIAAGDEFATTRVIIGIIRDPAYAPDDPDGIVFDPSVDDLTQDKIAEIESLIGDDGALPGIAYVSAGVSYDTTVTGGDGDDEFSVYQNKGELELNGDAGNDSFIVRAFVILPGAGFANNAQAETLVQGGANDDSIQYAVNAPVRIDGGTGFDTVVVLGTPFPDSFVVTDTGIFGAGLHVTFENVESAELDTLEGNDTIYVLATNENLVTRIIAGQGDDTVLIMGDVMNDIVSAGADDWPERPQDLSRIRGPLIVIGGVLEGADRSFQEAILLPGETDGNIFAESTTDTGAGEAGDIDRLDVFNTDSTATGAAAAAMGTLRRLIENPMTGAPDDGWTALTGFGTNADGDVLLISEPNETGQMVDVPYERGIAYTGFEIFELMLGTGDETLTIEDTADDAISVIHGGGGADTITILDRGRGPLIVYGDTSEDRLRYSNAEPSVRSPHGTAFTNDGADTIDASAMQEQYDGYLGVVIYGGFGNDTIDGSQIDDYLAGGTGDDTIRAHGGNDNVYGDSHFNVDPQLFAEDQSAAFDDADPRVAEMFEILIATAGDDNDAGTGAFIEAAGDDTIEGGDGADVIFGDHGVIDIEPGVRRLTTMGAVIGISTTLPDFGGNDTIDAGGGNDIVLGGTASDRVQAGSGNDIVFGDFAEITVAGGIPVVLASTNHQHDNMTPPKGAADTIFGNEGDDIIVGGVGDDLLDGDEDSDLMFGDAVRLQWRDGDITNPRFQVLLGQMLYSRYDLPAFLQGPIDAAGNPTFDYPTSGNEAGGVLVTGLAQDYRNPRDPDGVATIPAWAAYEITNLYHSDTIEDMGPDDGGYGDDYIAGGAGHDTIFGQLGDDVIQGDGSIDSAARDVNPVRVASRNSATDPWQIGASSDAVSDGDDYIEGNGGSDVIFGNLGQDDIVGGSSSLFTLGTADHRPDGTEDLRPDGTDYLYGGSGTATGRNDDGTVVVGDAAPYARDADVIAGDNANIYRIAGTENPNADGFLSFGYDVARGDSETIRVRAVELLDYTAGGPDYDPLGAASDNGDDDEIHGESGDDFIYGMAGDDVLFGDSQDDDLVGGWGNDWISGGQGMDGILGDDGRIYTGRYEAFVPSGGQKAANRNNAADYAEPLNGILMVDQLDKELRTPGGILTAIVHPTELINGVAVGEIFKTVDLTPFDLESDAFQGEMPPVHANDILYGGLGNDFMHGGPGDDAMSGTEAPAEFFNAPHNPGDILSFNPERIEFADYSDEFPRREIPGFILNFDPWTDDTNPGDDNYDEDVMFGDLGNDWLVGGPDNDQMFGGYGNDLLDADDDKSTVGGDNTAPDLPNVDSQDIAYGGAGRDVLIANTGGDRLIDWVGEFNSFIVPFGPFGLFTITRAPTPQNFEFLYGLSEALGADQSRAVDSGKDPQRNGEPEGELGLVMSKDADWQEQTGAPTDPQPGNIPGGERLTLRGVNFNSGTTEAFAVDQGQFRVVQGRLEVSPTNLGETATAVFHVGEYLPHYFEMKATISTGKPIAGMKANSYLIFDYVSPTDFKYAGINISTDKLEMGYVDSTGWHQVVQVPAQLKHSTDYGVLLAINGTTATLVVNNKDILSYTFAPRVDSDGFSYGLNYGLVGLGGDSSLARIDDLVVQKLSPEITFEATEDFGLGAPGFTAVDASQWTIAGGHYTGTGAAGGVAMSLFDLDVDPNSYLELEVTVDPTTLGGVVFDHYPDGTYKFAGVLADTNQVVIGHVGKAGTVVYDAVANITFARPSNTDYTLRVSLQGATVSVAVLGGSGPNQTWYEVVGHVFNAVVVDGQAGLLSAGGASSFDAFAIRTDDPAFLSAGEELVAPSLSLETNAPNLDASAIGPVLDEAIRRMTLEFGLDADQQAMLADVQVLIGDLPGLVLARNNGMLIEIDVNAAGHGWFVDGTAGDDTEFDSAGRALPGSPAAGDMDLLSALMHELGHVLGYEHGSMPVMTDSLTTGERLMQTGDTGAPIENVIESALTRGQVLTGAKITPNRAEARLGIEWRSDWTSRGLSFEAARAGIAGRLAIARGNDASSHARALDDRSGSYGDVSAFTDDLVESGRRSPALVGAGLEPAALAGAHPGLRVPFVQVSGAHWFDAPGITRALITGWWF